MLNEALAKLQEELKSFTGREVMISTRDKWVKVYILYPESVDVPSETWDEIQNRVINVEWALADALGKPDGHLPYYLEAVLVEKFPNLPKPEYVVWEGKEIIADLSQGKRVIIQGDEEYVVVPRRLLAALEETVFIAEV